MEIEQIARCMVGIDRVFEKHEVLSDEDKVFLLENSLNVYRNRVEMSEKDVDLYSDDEDDDEESEGDWLEPDPEADYDKLVETPEPEPVVLKPLKKEEPEVEDDDGFESLGIDDAEKPQKPKSPVVNSKPKTEPVIKSKVSEEELDDEDLVF